MITDEIVKSNFYMNRYFTWYLHEYLNLLKEILFYPKYKIVKKNCDKIKYLQLGFKLIIKLENFNYHNKA